MTPEPNHPMRENLAWAQWWAFPWDYAHEDWKDDKYQAINALYRSRRLVPSGLTGVVTCLPARPQPAVLHMALASTEQLNMTLALVHDTFNPQAPGLLSDNDHLWCIRLSKALPPDMLSSGAEPLQLLHSWVEPAIWQRLRLRFSRARVLEVEKNSLSLDTTNNRLNTLWQAVVWRVTTLASDHLPLDANE